MTLNGRNVTLVEMKKFTEPTRKIGRKIFIFFAAKCRSMILISRNIMYMWIFTGVSRDERQLSNDSNGHALRPSILRCVLSYLRPICVTWPRILSKTSHISVPKKAQKCRTFNSRIRPTMKSIIHHGKHIGLHSVILCKISAF